MSSAPEKPWRVLIVDDERLARQRLVDLLNHHDTSLEILEAANGLAAVDLINASYPDLVFLDIKMPGLDGFQVIQAVGIWRMPLTIFVTAYNLSAVAQFEHNMLDYLLKPFSKERFQEITAGAIRRLAAPSGTVFGRDLAGLFSDKALTLDMVKNASLTVHPPTKIP